MSNEEAEVRAYAVHVSGVADAVINVTVRADMMPEDATPDDWKAVAVEEALSVGVPRLCHKCSEHQNNVEEWRVGDWHIGAENLTDNVEEL